MTDRVLNVPGWCQLNKFIDARDSMNDWCASKVTEINLESRTVTVTMDGWGTKWNATYPLKSSKLAPFRKMSKGYTGPKRRAFRDWDFSMAEIQEAQNKVNGLLSENLECENAFETTQFYRGELFILVENMLVFDYSSHRDYLSSAVHFFASVINLIVKWLNEAPQLFPYYYQGLAQPDLYLTDNKVALASVWYELLDTLNKLFALESRVSAFYLHFDEVPIGYDPSPKTIVKNSNYSDTLLFLINYFAKLGGFEAVLNILKNKDEHSRVPFPFVNSILLYALNQFIDPEFSSDFFTEFTGLIFQRIKIISDTELKDLKHEEILNLLARMGKLSENLDTEALEVNKLNLFLAMLKCSYLEKRIKGLTEINYVLESLEPRINVIDNSKVKVSAEEMQNWILKENIINVLLAERPHVELVKRASPLLKFLARNKVLEEKHLEQLWSSTQGKHDSFIRATYSAIIDITPYLREDHNDFLFERFSQIKLEDYDEQLVNLIKDFTAKAISVASSSAMLKDEENTKWYGVSLLESIMLDSSPHGLWKLGTKYLGEVLSMIDCRSLIGEYAVKAVNLIRNNDSVPQAIKLLMSLVSSLDPRSQKIESKKLEASQEIQDLIVNNLKEYMNKAREIGKSIKIEQVIQGRFSHEINIKRRLKILEFIIHTTDSEIRLNIDHFTTLWGIFISPSVSAKETDLFFKWLTQGFKHRSPLTLDIADNLFRNFFLQEETFPSESITLQGYNCFRWLLINLNSHLNAIETTSAGRLRNRNSRDVLGLDKLLSIQLNCQQENISQEALKLVISLLTRYDSEILSEAADILNEFTNSLLNTMISSSASDTLIKRGLTLIKSLLGDDEDDDSGKSYYIYVREAKSKDYKQLYINQNKNIRHLRKEVAKLYNQPLEKTLLHINEKQFGAFEDDIDIKSLKLYWLVADFDSDTTSDFSPHHALSQNQEIAKALFHLLSSTDKPYAELAWDLLISLPVNEKLVEELNKLERPITELIDISSMHHLLYCLNILLKLSKDIEWGRKFTSAEGTKFLLQIFLMPKEEYKGGKLVIMKEDSMIKLLSNLISYDTVLDNMQGFIESLFVSFNLISSAATTPGQIEDSPALFRSLESLIDIISFQSEDLLRNYIIQTPELLRNLLKGCLIKSVDPNFSSNSCALFERIFDKTSIFSEAFLELNQMLDLALTEGKTSNEYWDLLAKVINHNTFDSEKEKMTALTQKLINEVNNHPGEKNCNEKDTILCGMIKVLSNTWKKTDVVPDPDEHLKLFLSKCLFEVPDKIDRNGITPPKCKHADTRNQTFDLILELSQMNENFLKAITADLAHFHEEPNWRTARRADWNNSPASKEKSLTGYVGLKNLGCTCYMNSLLQQLFMISTFREAILNSPPPKPYEESLLYQLQHIFSGLKHSDKQYINTKGFAKVFKDFEGNPINPMEQMDVDEFFGSFMDKLEDQLKGTEQAKAIKSHFGGLQATEIIGKDCTHRSERIEPFLSIPVEVKTKKSVIEGLESYVAGEMLEGENAYQCDHCDAKVRAIRRVCVKHLPNFLVVALRRFEFDFDTMNRLKLNDYYEFPHELDMEPYTQEGLERIEKEKEKQAGKDVTIPNKKFPDDYYKYSLRGIVIHSGTAESGHYYSYIFDAKQNKWYEFNDNWVREIDPKDIPNDCFGGEEKYSWSSYTSFQTSGIREKYGNGYLLFYERSGIYKSREPDDENIERVDLNVKEAEDLEHYKQVRAQNQKYWRSRHIFGPEYSRFVMGLTKLENPPDKFLIQFLLTIQIRTKEKRHELVAISQRVNKVLSENPEMSEWLLEMLSVESIAKELLIHCPVHLVRRFLVGLVKTCLKCVSEEVRVNFFKWQINYLTYAHKKHSKHYAQFLEILKESILRVPNSAQDFGAIDILVAHLLRDTYECPSPPPFKNSDIYLGYDGYPQTENSIKDDSFFADSKGSSNAHLYHTLFIFRAHLSEDKVRYLKQPTTIAFILREIDSKLSARSIGKLYAIICNDDLNTTNTYMRALKECYQNAEYYFKAKYLRVFTPFLIHEDSIQKPKIENFLAYMFKTMKGCKYQSEVEQSINYIYKITSKYPVIRQYMVQNTEDLQWLEKWITQYMKVTYSTFKNTTTQQPEEYIRPAYQAMLAKCKKLSQGEAPNSPDDWDSDEDLNCKFKIGDEVDVLDQAGQSWVKAKVEANIGELIWLSLKQWSAPDQWVWRDVQSEDLAPAGAKSAQKFNISL